MNVKITYLKQLQNVRWTENYNWIWKRGEIKSIQSGCAGKCFYLLRIFRWGSENVVIVDIIEASDVCNRFNDANFIMDFAKVQSLNENPLWGQQILQPSFILLELNCSVSSALQITNRNQNSIWLMHKLS